MATAKATNPISLRDFLESVPPGVTSTINDLGGQPAPGGGSIYMDIPEIRLHCATDSCGGTRFFRTSETVHLSGNQVKLTFIRFACKNCSSTSKTFALWLKLGNDRKAGQAFKYGEVPAFGPPTPSRVISLIGPDRDLFLKGRRSENQGLGIAAFAYYRRVIEGQKDRIFDEIIRVCKRLAVEQAIIEELTQAKAETQFSKAVEVVKHAIPQALLVNGHNPLTLLHSALSEGLHAQTDEECLEIATSIRVVMADFAERMGQALKEEAEISAAVTRLLSKKAAKPLPVKVNSPSLPKSE